MIVWQHVWKGFYFLLYHLLGSNGAPAFPKICSGSHSSDSDGGEEPEEPVAMISDVSDMCPSVSCL